MALKFNPFTGNFDEVQDLSSYVVGPASGTDNALVRFDSTTGKLVQNSSLTGQDDGRLTLGADGTANLDAVTKQQLDAVISTINNFSWQESVIDKDLTAPPGSPSTGDRYLIGLDTTASAATGAWAGQDGNIAEWNGSSWDFTSATTGTFVAAEDESDVLYLFGGTVWDSKAFEATTASGFLSKSGFDIQLTNLTDQNVIVGNGSNIATSVNTNSVGDVSADTTNGLLIKSGAIDNDNINASAAIDASKIADGSVSSTEFQYINSLTSNAQTQIDAKLTSPLTTKGDVIVRDASTEIRLAVGSNGQHLVADSTTASGLAYKNIHDIINISATGNATDQRTHLVDTSTLSITLTLPTPASGARVIVKDKSGEANTRNITINPNGGENIDGASSFTMDSNYDSKTFISDGTDWYVI